MGRGPKRSVLVACIGFTTEMPRRLEAFTGRAAKFFLDCVGLDTYLETGMSAYQRGRPWSAQGRLRKHQAAYHAVAQRRSALHDRRRDLRPLRLLRFLRPRFLLLPCRLIRSVRTCRRSGVQLDPSWRTSLSTRVRRRAWKRRKRRRRRRRAPPETRTTTMS